MSLSLILIGIISIIVILGTIYLIFNKNQQLTESKKNTIILIVVTSIKYPTIHHHTSNNYYDINQIFYRKDCKYDRQRKYQSNFAIPEEIINEVYLRNYHSVSKRVKNEKDDDGDVEYLLFLSRKDEGASYFLTQLAQKTCKEGHPTLYFKLEQQINNQIDFTRKAGFISYQQLKKSICHLSGISIHKNNEGIEYLSKGKNIKSPYIIIDNFDYLINTLSVQSFASQDQEINSNEKIKYISRQYLIQKIIIQLGGKCNANLIFNSQNEEGIERLYSIWQTTIKNKDQFKYFPFQFHQWQGLRHYDLYKIGTKLITNSDNYLSRILETNKKEHYNFNDLFTILRQVQLTQSANDKNLLKKQDLNLREFNMKTSVARYFGLSKVYKQIRSSQSKSVSCLKQKISLKKLWKLESLNLVSIRNGQIFVQ